MKVAIMVKGEMDCRVLDGSVLNVMPKGISIVGDFGVENIPMSNISLITAIDDIKKEG